jgi:hypothetical protein
MGQEHDFHLAKDRLPRDPMDSSKQLGLGIWWTETLGNIRLEMVSF